ncbi:MAG TPA: hypothetical protein PLD59_10625 [Tepidisphaeraceae bacterium]|nr:hypothetical protein [Tepidisphaeraceae bacterium]
MRAVVLTAIVLVIVGTLLHPFYSGARTVEPARGADGGQAVARVDDGPSRALETVRGTQGFWRIARAADGVWWFISPDNEPDWLNTVTTVVPYQTGRDPDGPHFTSTDYTPEGGDAAIRAWAEATLSRIQAKGFKGIGAWSHHIFHELDVPITRDLNLWTYLATDCRRFYSPQWAETVEAAVKEQVTPLRDNRNLVGYFIDNELDWGEGGAGPAYYFDNLPPDDPNRAAVMRVVRQVWPSVEEFNKAWNTTFATFEELAQLPSLPDMPSESYGRLYSAWLESLSRDYFTLTTSLIRKYDPNHLVLGVRFKGYAPREVVRGSRGLTDVQSINYYVSDGRLDMDMFSYMYEESGQPVMITEYAFHSLDGRSGNRNTVGFAAQVLDQQARADGYRLFTSRLARVPFIIGADWFQWSDEPPSGRRVDGEDVNFGIVDIDDRPYELLASAIAATSGELNAQHRASATDAGSDIWRESFAVKPTINVPYLTQLPRLNGELSDWPPAAKVQGMKRSQTIGLDRSRQPVPNIYMGWTHEGVYLGMEVFDDDIQSAPAKGWWWTRDCVEFWIATKPVASDQVRYDPNCHQFFFVPIDYPGSDGVAGVVGQWHRPGDALSDNLIPHPAIKDAVRVLPDRYVVEMFIPAAALNGFDPETTREISVNFHARNFQHAIEYFWSAPKEAVTQLRPNTWGTAYLQPPPTVANGD